MPNQDPREVTQLIENLEAASTKKSGNKRGFTCRKVTYEVSRPPGNNPVLVDSWKFNDWDYKRSDLPTYARGLFTTRRHDGTPEIVVRGYDKFFNVDEVSTTRWDYIEKNTRGPYELSVKENGCIVFISGLEGDTLLVCSKHSTGPREDTEVSHAQVGERWVEKHVTTVGKSVKDLARELRQANITAVGELCDDSFEEHVLAYDETAAGIYLHGINFNLPQFATLPGAAVYDFADRWGFKKAKFLLFDQVDEVKGFLKDCEATGTWDGRETEGFVVRCELGSDNAYQDWFFKYKFEEPYLMYRQWRECTKAVIAGREPKIKKHQKATEEYLRYARRQFAKDPKLAKMYTQNHGIIALRDGFLEERGVRGSDIILNEEGENAGPVTRNVILVTIASLGCGKTTVALGLAHLFGWAHIQNDNIPKQKNKPKRFANEVINALAESPVVIADRNSHQKRERAQLVNDTCSVIDGVRYVALHWVHEPKDQLLPEIRQVTRQRILDRGDNHQTIRSQSSANIMGIMEGFLMRFEGVDPTREPDSEFDEIIDLDVSASSRENLEKAAAALHAKYPQLVDHMPTAQELDEAIDWAVNKYQVRINLSHQYANNNNSSKNKQRQREQEPKPPDPSALAKSVEYFNISVPAAEVTSLLNMLFRTTDVSPAKAWLYNHLVAMRRLQRTFHVTLIHRAMKQSRSDIWDSYISQYLEKIEGQQQGQEQETYTVTPTLGTARVRLERLVWSARIMAFVVRIMPGSESEVQTWKCANAIPHITVGTASAEVKPKESNDMLELWLREGSGDGGQTGIWEMEIPGVKVVKGVVTEVLARGKGG